MFKRTCIKHMAAIALIAGALFSAPVRAEPQITISRQGQALEPGSQAYQNILQTFHPFVKVQHEYYGDDPRCNYPVVETGIEYSRFPSAKPGLQVAFYVEMKQDSQSGEIADYARYSAILTYYGALNEQLIETKIEPRSMRYYPGMFLRYFSRQNYLPDPSDRDDGFIHYTAIGNNTWKFTWDDFNAAVLRFRFWPDTDQMQDYIEIEVRENAYTVNRQAGSERCPINLNRLANP